MQLNDLSHPLSSKALNESVAKKFGYKLDIQKFSLQQLREARNSLLNKLSLLESTKKFDALHKNTEYHKNRLFLDVITHAIAERTASSNSSNTIEESIEHVRSSFNRKYGTQGARLMKETVRKMSKSNSIDEAIEILDRVLSEQLITEGEEEKAALIMSSRDMVDKLTGWLEDVASLKAEALLELIDSIRDELGSDTSQRFVEKVRPALEDVYASLETNREVLSQAVAILTGEEVPGTEGTPMQQATNDPLSDEAADDFGGEEVATGGTSPEGRTKRESVEYSRRLGTILSSKKK
jgi:hypothetical protein